MKDRTKNTPQVLLRRALLVLLDAAIVAFSFYFALLLRADGAVEALSLIHIYSSLESLAMRTRVRRPFRIRVW